MHPGRRWIAALALVVSLQRPAAADPAADSVHATASPEVLRACTRFGSQTRIRVRGDFGVFDGHAKRVGLDGLGGLERRRGGDRDKARAAMVEGGLFCAGLGASIGGLLGTAIPAWHQVYPRR